MLSLLAVRDGPGWKAVSGSLLTLPDEVAQMSWRQWSALQPHAAQHVDSRGTLDPGAVFRVEPFDRVRAMRHAMDAQEWRSCVESLGRGEIMVNGDAYELATAESTPAVLLGQDGVGPAYDVVAGVMRPVRGIMATLEVPELPETGSTWELDMPENLKPGPELGRLRQERHFLQWPKEILGIEWTGDTKIAAPAPLVIGRPVSKAWIVRVKPDFDTDSLIISIGWDEQRINPLGCSLLIRTESNRVPLLVRHLRITKLPATAPAASEPRDMAWSERTLDVRVPRGARRTEWGFEPPWTAPAFLETVVYRGFRGVCGLESVGRSSLVVVVVVPVVMWATRRVVQGLVRPGNLGDLLRWKAGVTAKAGKRLTVEMRERAVRRRERSWKTDPFPAVRRLLDHRDQHESRAAAICCSSSSSSLGSRPRMPNDVSPRSSTMSRLTSQRADLAASSRFITASPASSNSCEMPSMTSLAGCRWSSPTAPRSKRRHLPTR